MIKRFFMKHAVYPKEMSTYAIVDSYNAKMEELAKEYKNKMKKILEERNSILFDRGVHMISSCKRCGNELILSDSLEGVYHTKDGSEVHVFVCSNCGKIHRYQFIDVGYTLYNGHDKNIPSFRSLRKKEEPIRERYFARIDNI